MRLALHSLEVQNRTQSNMLWILFRLMDGEFPFGGICNHEVLATEREPEGQAKRSNPAANEYKDLQSEITRLRSATKQITDIFSGLKILILGCGRITTTKCSRPNGSPKGKRSAANPAERDF